MPASLFWCMLYTVNSVYGVYIHKAGAIRNRPGVAVCRYGGGCGVQGYRGEGDSWLETLTACLIDQESSPALGALLRILDSMHVAILVVDRAGHIVYANKGYSRITGVPAPRVLGRDLRSIEPDAEILQVLQTGIPRLNSVMRLQSIDAHLVADQTPVFDAAGRLLGAVGTFKHVADVVANDYGNRLRVEPPPELPSAFQQIRGRSPRLLAVLVQARQVAASDCTVLIRGETGVGKELLARAIHEESPRRNQPLVVVNCAAIPEHLLESELFGYEGGAFTGAAPKGKQGKFELASGGTLFLDEIGEMAPNMQSKLLRVLQDGVVDRVGGVRPRRVNVRVIAATNRRLEQMLTRGAFREDLYYRLNIFPIVIPPLRERKDDIPLLVDAFVSRWEQEAGRRVQVSADYIYCLQVFDWPGNVRELENVLQYSLIVCTGDVLLPRHLPPHIGQDVRDGQPPPPRRASRSAGAAGRGHVAAAERDALVNALKACAGNRSKAMRLLGVSRATFYKKLWQHGLMGAAGRMDLQ